MCTWIFLQFTCRQIYLASFVLWNNGNILKQIFSQNLGVKNAPKVGFNLNFLQKVKFMQSLCLNYSGNSKSTDRIKYTTQIPCPCRFQNTPYLNWLLLISLSGGLSKFTYIWYFLIFSSNWQKIQNCQLYLKFGDFKSIAAENQKIPNVCELWHAATRAY